MRFFLPLLVAVVVVVPVALLAFSEGSMRTKPGMMISCAEAAFDSAMDDSEGSEETNEVREGDFEELVVVVVVVVSAAVLRVDFRAGAEAGVGAEDECTLTSFLGCLTASDAISAFSWDRRRLLRLGIRL